MATATPWMEQQTAGPPTRLLACELGEHTWPLGGTTGAAQRPRARQAAAGECPTVWEESRRAKPRFGLPANTRGIRGGNQGRTGIKLGGCCSFVEKAKVSGTTAERPLLEDEDVGYQYFDTTLGMPIWRE